MEIGIGRTMNVRDLILELTGVELDNYMESLGLSRDCLDRKVEIEFEDKNEQQRFEISDCKYDQETDTVVLEF